MAPIFQIVITALEAVGEACGRKKRKSAEEIEGERAQRRKSRTIWFFIILAAVACLIFLVK